METKKVIFTEEQRYRPIRVRVVLPVVLGVTFVAYALGISQEYKHNGSFNETLPLILTGVGFLVFTIVIMTVLYRMKLITLIYKDGIYLRYPPLQARERIIPAESIQSFEKREYRPRFEYGGHGYRVRGRALRKRKYGISFTASGNTGIQLVLNDGKKILIGTQRPEAFLHGLNTILGSPKDQEKS